MHPLSRLDLWLDDSPRTAPETMAVDSYLHLHITRPTLRIYHWPPGWGSFGYFGKHSDALAHNPSLQWLRRFTGGGIVNHSSDWTYTLIIPTTEPLATLRGGQSYLTIHQLLAQTLQLEQIRTHLCDTSLTTHSLACFQNPVSHDIITPNGQKLAGAGQRRSRHALLHQGSLNLHTSREISHLRAQNFSQLLAPSHQLISPTIPTNFLSQEISSRFASPTWLHLR